MLHPAANGHPKAAHQWLLMGAQACRLAALKPLQLKALTTRHGGPSLPFTMLHPAVQQVPQGHTSMASYGRPLQPGMGGPSLPFAMLHPAANRHLKATHQWLLMGVQAYCRLPSLPLNALKIHQTPNRHPKATHQWLLMGVQACWGSKPAVCQPLNPKNL